MSLTFQATPFAAVSPPPPGSGWPPAGRRIRVSPDLAPAFVAQGGAQAARQRLLAGGWCVTSGQQPGLFTGPILTLYKAISAAVLARSLEARLGEPVTPVFWVAGDDHDFAEANHCYILDIRGEPRRLELRTRSPDGPLTPLYREPVGPEIESVLDRMREATPDSEFRPALVDWLQRHYRPEADLATAFGGALAELLAPLDVVVFQASHPAAKAAMAPWVGRVLERSPEILRALDRRAGELAVAGRPVPVPVGDEATPVMLEGRLGRDRLLAQNGRFVARRSGESWSGTELTSLLAREPHRFSANVLLRPVIEAAMLPTLAYVAGPGELDYLPQADPIYQILGVEPQGRVPRWSGRVIESRVQRVLEKHRASAEELGATGDGLEAALARDDLPPEGRNALAALREGIQREYARLVDAATTVDPTLQKPVESARNSALVGVADIEKRLIAHLKRQNETTAAQIARARAALFPLGRPQERVVNVSSFLVRYGTSFIGEARHAVEQWLGRLEPAPRGP